jgi:hypothetical protein
MHRVHGVHTPERLHNEPMESSAEELAAAARRRRAEAAPPSRDETYFGSNLPSVLPSDLPSSILTERLFVSDTQLLARL